MWSLRHGGDESSEDCVLGTVYVVCASAGRERGPVRLCVRARLMFCLLSAASGAAWWAELMGVRCGLAARAPPAADRPSALDAGPLRRSCCTGRAIVAVRALFLGLVDRRRMRSVEVAQADEAVDSFLRGGIGGPDAVLVSRSVVRFARLGEVTVDVGIEYKVCVVGIDIAEGFACGVRVVCDGLACVV